MTREEVIKMLQHCGTENYCHHYIRTENCYGCNRREALDMAIEALSSDAIAKAYNQGFVEGSVNATVNSNHVCPRCGKIMERKEGGDTNEMSKV